MKLRTAMLSSAIVLAVLTGCAQQSTEYPAETASALQSQVLLVSESAADGDPETALVRLDELEASVKDALARETITQERYDSIIASITLVRADLESAIAAIEEQQRLEEEKRQEEDKKGNDDEGEDDKPGKGNKDD